MIRKGFIRKRSKKELPKLKAKLTKVFNEFIRRRDMKAQKGICISCDKPGNQAGHYLPTSSNPQPSLVFNEKNVNLQCAHCNCWLHGNQHDYAKGLIKKYGEGIIDELDVIRSLPQNPWMHFEYEMMIKTYQQKLKEFV